ncbi:hypothetical protein [Neisseria wadsworthii]|uniref:hypothetical protein n=1 Tax=Neisseria wadsworthii TaxID=607711 RepID=UPI0012EAA0F5|nr:hypothetical protein [Neisseria wadsworthii]QMT36482.1 hypothetical protein H3L96_04490 [Neisseria wadsworthii]
MLKAQRLTLRDCVDTYNRKYQDDITNNIKAPLNKDFIQRVRSGKCKVISRRVVDLCIFLQIDPYEQSGEASAIQELKDIENLIRQYPVLESGLLRLLQDIHRLLESNLEKMPLSGEVM